MGRRNYIPGIMGGIDTKIEKFPYVVQIAHWIGSAWTVQCDGVILEFNIILTAGHCIPIKFLNTKRNLGIEILAGTTFLEDFYGGKFRNVRKKDIRIHPLYNILPGGGVDYDVALIKLKQKLRYSQKIKTITITTEDYEDMSNTDGKYTGTLVGWGYTGPKTRPHILQKIKLDILGKENCQKFSYYGVTDRIFCAIYKKDYTRGGCGADSGGPFIVSDMLYGIVSSGFGGRNCSFDADKLLHLTRLTERNISDWIRKTKKELLKDDL
ncbi:vitamin K-dependent protein C-like [Chrysoperla carnea]|uniref:vitamin K-dependent protein C-like n=1 Tax=Chrysoperla carnea TaxID=189513 RepID=UPI001D067325|nr:vitamin K-dependent protein C-like [Chrysoperla carnea]